MSSLRRRAISSTSQVLMPRPGVPVWHSLVPLPDMMPRTLTRMWIWMALAIHVLRLDGQHEEEGHERHHPSVDAKGGVPDEEAQCPTNDHDDADSKVDVLSQTA